MKTLIAFSLLCLSAPIGHSADLCPLVARLNQIVTEETGYATPACPVISFSELPPGGVMRSQAGAYMPDTGRIALAPDLDLTGAFGQSYLLHELVHAAQYAAGAQTRVACPAALEAEAYTVQADFLRQRGLGQDAVLIGLLAQQLGRCGAAIED